jgi:putative acetyltransferase
MTEPAAIRPERSEDEDQVRLVNQRAFGQPGEAALVDALRDSDGAISLVAVMEHQVVGHILFTPVKVEGVQLVGSAVGLAPMAVMPEHQRKGIGSQLVRAGLDACRSLGHVLVVVVGHPSYYPRFGFVPAAARGLEYERPLPPDVFMLLELKPGSLNGARGVVRYRPEFAALTE